MIGVGTTQRKQRVSSPHIDDMASSLIEELQHDATDQAVRTSDLLRKALLVASKLDIPGVPDWIEKELSGYAAGDEVPTYRKLRGRVMARTFRGWSPVQFPTTEFETKVAEQHLHQSINEIEELVTAGEDSRCNFVPEIQQLLQTLFRAETEFACRHSRASVAAVLDKVKNRILRWSLALEKAGVRGDGMTFTPQEKAAAHHVVVQGVSVMNVGVIGDIHAAANIAAGKHARVGNLSPEEIGQLVSTLRPHISAATLAIGDADALSAALAELEACEQMRDVDPTKVRGILRRVLGIAGKIGDHVLAAGIKVVVEGWMRAHGLVP
jgi:hypothetical protein